MADEKKTLEMRVAELEDKLAQLHISEEEMQTYQKVASKLGGRGLLVNKVRARPAWRPSSNSLASPSRRNSLASLSRFTRFITAVTTTAATTTIVTTTTIASQQRDSMVRLAAAAAVSAVSERKTTVFKPRSRAPLLTS